MEEVTAVAQQHHLHVLGVSEAALHGAASRTRRKSPTTLSAIQHQLVIPGYTLIVPGTWTSHSQARLIVYIKDSVSYKLMKVPNTQDLPLITMEVWKGGHKRQWLS